MSVAVPRRSVPTWPALRPRPSAISQAAAPATIGADMLVPYSRW